MSSRQPAAAGSRAGPQEHQQQQLENEDAWSLLLEGVWELDQRVICKLLCCSRAMQQLVHSTCAGRLAVTISGLGDSTTSTAQLTHWPQHHAPGRWLAKHAGLCSSIEVDITEDTLPAPPEALYWAVVVPACRLLDALMAAGLRAATAGPGSSSLPRMTRQQAAECQCLYPQSQKGQAAALAGAQAQIDAAAVSGGMPPQPLRLVRFVSHMPSSTSMLCSLAGATQLTGLAVDMTWLTQDAVPGCRDALASLTDLQELALSCDRTVWGGPYYEQLLVGLQSLTCLSRLCLPCQLGFTCVLPPSLVHIDFGGRCRGDTLNLDHLSCLTELHAGLPATDKAEIRLPPLLQVLHLPLLRHVEHVLQLHHLRQLHLHTVSSAQQVEQLQQLSALPQLDTLVLGCLGQCTFANSGVIRAVGCFSQLTHLGLHNVTVNGGTTDTSWADSMCSLKQLQSLSLTEGPSGLSYTTIIRDALWQDVPSLPALRSLLAEGCHLSQQAASSLAAATQLTSVKLIRCHLSREAQHTLRSGLAHLLPAALCIEQ